MTYPKTIVFLFFIICLITISQGANPFVINPPIVLYTLIYICLVIFIILGIIDRKFQNIPTYSKRIIIIYWFYSIFIIIYGLIFATSYWDYKNIFIAYVPGVFMSFAIFVGLEFEKNLSLLRFIIKIIFPFTAIVGIISYTFFYQPFYELNYDNAVTRLAAPIFFFILAMPFLRTSHKFFIIFISIFCLTIDLDWRENILRITTCWSFVLIYFLFLLKKRLLNFIGIIFFVTPLIFLYSGFSGKLDIFEYMAKDEQSILGTNTRTFLYVEVFESIKNKNTNLLIGGGAAAGYQTEYFAAPKVSLYAKRDRYKTEARFLNALNQAGIIGVIIDMLLLFIPGYLAVNRSNNSFSKLLGLYLFSSWPLYFLGMPLALNINYFLYYFVIGLCLNNSLRKSDDKQIKFFFKSL